MVNLGYHRLPPLPEPPSKLQRVGEYAGAQDSPLPEIMPTPTPISVEPEEILTARGSQLGRDPYF